MIDEPVINVMLVDDHDMVRLGLRTAIQDSKSLKVIAEANNGEAAFELYCQFRPDITLLDLFMPKISGIECATLILQHDPNAKIIALTSYEKDDLVQSAIEIGVKGYLLKSIPMEELERGIHEVFQGRIAYGQEATQALIRLNQNRQSQEVYNLTPGELRVLEYVVAGMSNKETANKLFISPSTVKKHVSNILAKLKANNRAEAAAIAVRYELLRKAD